MQRSVDEQALVDEVRKLVGDAEPPHLYDRERYHAWAARYGFLIRFDARMSTVIATRFGDDGKLHRVVWKVRFK